MASPLAHAKLYCWDASPTPLFGLKEANSARSWPLFMYLTFK